MADVGKLAVPSTAPEYLNLTGGGKVGIPIFPALPALWETGGIVAVQTGTQTAPIFTYSVWDGAAWQELASTDIVLAITLGSLLPIPDEDGLVLQSDSSDPTGFSWRKLHEDTNMKALRPISTLSPEAVGHQIAALATAAPADSNGPTANIAILVPFHLDQPTHVYRFFWLNGTAVSGNIDVGIYTSNLTLIGKTGSTGQVTTNVVQLVTHLGLYLPAGDYYLAYANDTGGVGQKIVAVLPTIISQSMCGIMEKASSFPLPALIVAPVKRTQTLLPEFGFTSQPVLT